MYTTLLKWIVTKLGLQKIIFTLKAFSLQVHSLVHFNSNVNVFLY